MEYGMNESSAKVESSTDGGGAIDICFTNNMGSLTSDAKSDDMNKMKQTESDSLIGG